MNKGIEYHRTSTYLMSLFMEDARPSGSAAEPGTILRINSILLRIGSIQHTILTYRQIRKRLSKRKLDKYVGIIDEDSSELLGIYI